MRRAAILAMAALAAPAAAEDQAPAPPDPGLLEFLGELGGEDPFFMEFMATSAAKRALRDAEKGAEGKPEEDDDE